MVIKKKNLKGKKVLITSCPTWVPIDRLRVISNIASGQIGKYLSEELSKKDVSVTLLKGPGVSFDLKKTVKILSFKYLDEFADLLKRELVAKKYDAIIHAAAVADYQPIRKFKGKIKSGIKTFSLDLKPTIKLVDEIKKLSPYSFLVVFKLEMNVSKKILIKKALMLLRRSRADLVVANTFNSKKYQAYIVSAQGKILVSVRTKKDLSKRLIGAIAQNL